MALIYDLADPQELAGFARQLQQELDENTFQLSQFLPNLNIDEIEYRVRTGQLQDEEAAMVRAWDTPAPIGTRQGVSQLIGELPPISKKYRLGEEERLRKRALERGSNAEIVNAIYDDTAKGVRSVTARVEMFRGEALYKRALEIDENGFVQDVPFEYDASLDVAPSPLWSDHTNATPVQDEQTWISDVYQGVNGNIRPALALTSTEVVQHLLLNAQYRGLSATNGVTPPFLSLAQVNGVRALYQLPPIVVNDELVRVEGVGQQRVIPADQFLYLPPATEPLGRTLFGTTAEALELVDARQLAQDQAPGLTVVVEKTFDPVATWTKTSAVGIPVLFNPNLILAATVL